MKKAFFRNVSLGLLGLGFAVSAQSSYSRDVTGVAGVYRSESTKVEGNKAGGESTFSSALRYSDKINPQSNVAWYGEAALQLSSYEGPENGPSPDNFTGLGIGGGLRYYFHPFSEYAVPYIGGGLSYASAQSVDFSTAGYTQTRVSGLFYDMSAGVRLGLDKSFFLEFDVPFFETGLWVVQTQESVSRTTTGTSKTKSETNKRALYVDSRAKLTDLMVGIGYKF